ncbi:hypothetical protein KUCAC02_012239 [Chaenocephalus aceratus]|uniref:Uncharacterized protein n=1 Tax=Chaenocephalus aceratus TaxID=36190 RepID=A0ACB9XAT6_CHAAC|nr:hypothetical protein KUCAC02_012239 [Chaenocephalus aceratus]
MHEIHLGGRQANFLRTQQTTEAGGSGWENNSVQGEPVKCCHVRSVVVNSLIYLVAKRDGIVITPVQRHSLHLVSGMIDSLNKRLAPRPLPSAYTPLRRLVKPIVCCPPGRAWVTPPSENPNHHIHHATLLTPREGTTEGI